MQQARLTRVLVVAAIAVAGPAALGLDLLARHFILGAQPADVREFLADRVTRIAWLVVPGPLLGGAVGFLLFPSLYARSLSRSRSSGAQAEERAEMHALLVATSLAQLPALFGDFSVMLGARLMPALCSTGIAVSWVVIIAFAARRRRVKARPEAV